MRRRIGDSAIRALTDYGYSGIIVEVDDRSAESICDADQAIPITINGINWTNTNYRREPKTPPITLIDVVSKIVDMQSSRLGIDSKYVKNDKKELKNISWEI